MAKTTLSNIPTMKVNGIRLPEDVYDTYSERAIKKGRDVESEIASHLAVTRTYNSTTPVYLDDNSRNELSQIAGKLLRTPEEIVAWARQISSLTVADVKIELSERLLTRLSTRTFGRSMPEMIRQTVTESLEEKVGLR
jgi:hypothetical protein